MTTTKIIPILLTLLTLLSCKSHKTPNSLNYHETDSCTTNTNLNVSSILSIIASDTINSTHNQDHIDFFENEGEIQIHPDGKVYIKGVRSADIARTDLQKTSTLDIVVQDSLSQDSATYSITEISAISKPSKTSVSHLNPWLILTLALSAIIILFLIKRFLLKSN